ncbi:type II toxin-antitoxin system VapC family toxin [Candidatus Saganbacteria bacterium]|nr:type II toxin-antitoxin system VapC family toxin [Candidatus Saganbacteria bacterium]
MSTRYILDSYALLCWFQDEKGADEVDKLISLSKERKASLFLNIINLGEVFYITYRERGHIPAQHSLSVIDSLPIELIGVDRSLTLKAAELKALFPLSYADAFAAASGIIHHGTVVTADPEFKRIEEIVKIKWL